MPSHQPYNAAKYREVHSISTQTSPLTTLHHNLLSISHQLHFLSNLLTLHSLPHVAGMARERGLLAAQAAGLIVQDGGWTEVRGREEPWLSEDGNMIRKALESIMWMDKQVLDEAREVLASMDEGRMRYILLLLLKRYSEYYWRSRGVYFSVLGRVGEFSRDILESFFQEI